MQSLQVLPPPDQEEFRLEARSALDAANALVVNDQESFVYGNELLKLIANTTKRIKDAFRESKESANKTHKLICDLENKALSGQTDARQTIDRKLAAYWGEQEKKRRAEQARLEAEAKQRADQAALDAAALLETAGDHRTAAAMLDEALAAPAPVIDVPQTKVAGVSMRKSWTWRLVDESKVDRKFLMVDNVKIGKLVRSMGPDAADMVGGVEIVEEFTTAVRAS